MKKLLAVLLLNLISYVLIASPVYAIEDPLSVPNNKFGIHILFTEELEEAARLVNSNNGEWGYVTIPIQAGDRDMEKWQKFFDSAKQNKVIPIVRLATEGDYFNTKVWRKPTEADILDFANFLNSLEWPTKNRYIIVFNEVNRSDEWGGATNPAEYSDILSYAVDVFKAKNNDFFIIASGMDNASITVLGSSYSQYSFFQLMAHENLDIFNKIDGIASHSYPNPGFSQPPTYLAHNSIASFKHERDFIAQFTTKKLPIFITETGWSKDRVSEEAAANYLSLAFSGVWNDDRIAAITPFLLRAGNGPFVQFSYIKNDGSKSLEYKAIEEISKTKGKPKLSPQTLGTKSPDRKPSPTRDFTNAKEVTENHSYRPSDNLKTFIKWFLQM